jgi:short-subunit dehydrogenase
MPVLEWSAPFWEAPVTDYSRLIDINLKGVVYGSHAAVRQFQAQRGGTLVNVGSVVSEVPMAYYACYSATKAGVLSLGRALNEELRLNGLSGKIKVATIMPWAADTPWFKHAANYSGHTPRMLALDEPSKVVDAIVNTAAHPSEEVPVGWKAQGACIAHRIAPDVTETISGNIVQREQMQKGAPAPVTTGSLYHSIQAGRLVEGGQREEMKREDQQRRLPATTEGPGSQ